MNIRYPVCLLSILAVFFFSELALSDRVVSSFNSDWRFTKGQQPDSAVQLDFDDSAWTAVRLPHDWAIAGPFNPEEHGYAGKLPWKGTGWYRKTFTLNAADAGKRVYLDFDGVMAFPNVYINGQLAGQWDYGYMSFRVDATPYVRLGQKNIIAVSVDTGNQGTRWYPGAGIYRKVTLTLCDPIHISHWGTFVTTPEVGDNAAIVCVQSSLENHYENSRDVSVTFEVTAPDGQQVVQRTQTVTIAAAGSATVEQELEITNPKRWDIINPAIYTLSTTIINKEETLDTEKTTFGIRTFEFTADDGFYLNGRRVQLYGVNLHHDHGALGAAFYTRAMERQLEIMQEMGVNAIRTSHNPPAPELLELCDRMGLVVWDECFDKWDDKAGRVKGQPPLEEYGEKQIRNFIMRDRNHPSIVVWSIGNEISNQPGDREGKSPERVKFMREFVLKYDATRPVGMACHIPQTALMPILDALDLAGWNYARRYENYRNRYPDKPIIYSESASALSTRGFYELPLPITRTAYSTQLQVDSYDLNAAPWSDIAESEFKLMSDDRFVAGEFVWTGFDYLGEPTPFDRQARSSYFGIVDLCGIPKDRYYLYRSHWRPNETTTHILPHWNWPDHIGQKVPVFVYTNGDSAELFLNGKSLGRRSKGQRPERPENFASGAVTTASSQQPENRVDNAVDGNSRTRWCADSEKKSQWLKIDLGRLCPVRCISLDFEKEAKNYGYKISASSDDQTWKEIAAKNISAEQWVRTRDAFHSTDVQARYVKIEFTELSGGTWASVRQIGIYPTPVESDYYAVTYDYRLRWNDVVYEPGRLQAVAYKDGKKIGEAEMQTAGPAAQIRLTPDRRELTDSGEDLSYVLVEALDEKGILSPLADNKINFKITGPAEIAGVDNGNPLSYEPFQADYRKLFYGKAMLIIRSVQGKTGTVHITASSEGLRDGKTELIVQ